MTDHERIQHLIDAFPEVAAAIAALIQTVRSETFATCRAAVYRGALRDVQLCDAIIAELTRKERG